SHFFHRARAAFGRSGRVFEARRPVADSTRPTGKTPGRAVRATALALRPGPAVNWRVDPVRVAAVLPTEGLNGRHPSRGGSRFPGHRSSESRRGAPLRHGSDSPHG